MSMPSTLSQHGTAAEYDSGSSMDGHFDSNIEGYDNEFVPPNHKYECPICLMCLRDPFQTDCGHRFCGSCINKWMRSEEQGKKCPVCNVVLKPSTVYPDNYAKREINNLRAKCRYTKLGCTYEEELKSVLKHQTICDFRDVPCPNHCGISVMYKNLEEHTRTTCPFREVECPICHLMVRLPNLEVHKARCATASNRCPNCNEELKGDKPKLHECNLPPDHLIICRFFRFGCDFKATVGDMKKHMIECQLEHLECLAAVVEKTMEEPRLEATDMQALEEQISNLLGIQTVPNSSTMTQPLSEYEEMDKHNMQSIAGAVPPRPPSPTKETKEKAAAAASAGAGKSAEDYFVPSESDIIRDLRNRVATQQQHILELRSKVTILETQMLEMKTELRDTKHELRSRSCDGSFVWRVCNYKKLREESVVGSPTCVLHSPGFYTSYNGYQFCMRLNLNGVENAQGTHLSLFIHIMQSDNDDILYWPFVGKVVLTILDQNPAVGKRKHITETLIAKPGLAAFQRPTSYRNHRGFGYMEFAPLSFIESSDRMFIKDDTLIIRADIKPNPPDLQT